jgi:BirA family biotin operon repressor/biotin-[acetyl-CoA-carboxylase] ligase
METLFVGQNIVRLQAVDSTNNYAAMLLEQTNVPEGTAILAGYQHGGRGQTGAGWYSDPGVNVLVSIVLRPDFLQADTHFLLSMAVAAAVRQTVSCFVPDNAVRVKWPNDVLVGNRKIAGVLIENTYRGARLRHSIVGIGMNVGTRDFPDLPGATSLALEAETAPDTERVLDRLCEELERRYLLLRAGQAELVRREYFEHLYGYGYTVPVVYRESVASGQIMDVADTGRAQVRVGDHMAEVDVRDIRFTPILP